MHVLTICIYIYIMYIFILLARLTDLRAVLASFVTTRCYVLINGSHLIGVAMHVKFYRTILPLGAFHAHGDCVFWSCGPAKVKEVRKYTCSIGPSVRERNTYPGDSLSMNFLVVLVFNLLFLNIDVFFFFCEVA